MKIANYYHSIRYLKPSQIYWMILRKLFRTPKKHLRKYKNLREIEITQANQEKGTFSCIKIFNKVYDLKELDSDVPLINYHLHYFDYLSECSIELGKDLIINWITNFNDFSNMAWDPYPLSLRIVNWIKFIHCHQLKNPEIFNSLYQQAQILYHRREYHLRTNHLMKNIVGLMFAGILFDERKWSEWGIKELRRQLSEQLTEDKYHIELSPTYHAIFCQDMLDCLNILQNEEINLLRNKLADLLPSALSWCEYFSDIRGYMPINDVNYEGCPSYSELNEYAASLNIKPSKNRLTNEHYPTLTNSTFKVMMYCAQHQPDFNPSHSHDDLCSILLWHAGKPILVDTGNYCYDDTRERHYARSTKAHNCFTIEDTNQSCMWKVFRVGRRSRILDYEVSSSFISCSHDGYKHFKVMYKRILKIQGDGFDIEDVFNSCKPFSWKIYFHFHPDTKLTRKGNELVINDRILISFQAKKWEIIKTEFYPAMFTRQEKQTVIIYGESNSKRHLSSINLLKIK